MKPPFLSRILNIFLGSEAKQRESELIAGNIYEKKMAHLAFRSMISLNGGE